MDTKFIGIGKAVEILGVGRSTIRLWEKQGHITPRYTPGGQRRYSKEQIEEMYERRNSVEEQS